MRFCLLVDVNTGEVLAMANSPSYNPNNLSGTPKEAMRNRTITDVFEPGSTVKPMVVMTALQRGVVRKTLYEVLYATPEVSKYPVSELAEDQLNDESRELGFYLQKGLFEEYAWFGRGHGHDLAPFDDYHKARGLRWPVVNGKETHRHY